MTDKQALQAAIKFAEDWLEWAKDDGNCNQPVEPDVTMLPVLIAAARATLEAPGTLAVGDARLLAWGLGDNAPDEVKDIVDAAPDSPALSGEPVALLPCPFCGGKPQHYQVDRGDYPHEHTYECEQCDASVGTHISKEIARKCWNCRVVEGVPREDEHERRPKQAQPRPDAEATAGHSTPTTTANQVGTEEAQIAAHPPSGEAVALLREASNELAFVRKFVDSRQRIAPAGLTLYDDLCGRILTYLYSVAAAADAAAESQSDGKRDNKEQL
jgi:Lar family restriction alleviation protein